MATDPVFSAGESHRGAWQARVLGVTELETQIGD